MFSTPSPGLRPAHGLRRASGRRPPPGIRVPRTPLLLAAMVGTLTAGCRDAAPPALEVAGVEYGREELLGLTPERKLLLGEITALGVAVSTGQAAELAEPLAAREERLWLARVLRAQEVLDSAGVEEDVLRARYRSDPALELTVRHLIVLSGRYETDQVRQEARQKAARALERIGAGEPFPQVAAEVSEEPGAEGRQGLLEPGREGAWVDEFWSAAAALEPGEISGVVETQYGFHVLRLEAKDTVPYEEVRPEVALEVARLMRASLDPSHLGLPEVRVDEEALASVTAGDATRERPVATWQGGSLTASQYRTDLAALPRARWEAARRDVATAVQEAREAAHLRMGAQRMRDRGVTPPGAVAAEVRRAWEQQVMRWSSAFGFREGMGSEALRTAALEGLGARGQGPTLAREELRERAPLLHLRYPIRVAETYDGGNP